MRVRLTAGVIVIGMLMLAPASTPSASAASDADHDGLSDGFERLWSHTSPYRADSDRDGTPDGREDPDRDGLTNAQEQTVGTDPHRTDSDGDRVRDDREDPDRDGLWNGTEFAAGTNPLIADTDRDGVRDDREDPDRDGLTNGAEQAARTNPRAADSDGDGTPDDREDPDADGLVNIVEIRAGTNPLAPDSDGDGTPDGREDPDRDGLANLVEQQVGTHPRRADSNGNGVPDGAEDPDGDGLSTLAELAGGTDPMVADTDGDGVLDGHASPPVSGGAPVLPGAPACTVFPAGNVWNTPVDGLPVLAGGATYIDTIGRTDTFHMDFGSWSGYGIPYQVVDAATPRSAVTFDYADESDPGPYPIPASPLIEAGSDRHMLLVDRDACRLYELYAVRRTVAGGWTAGSGAIWDLGSNALRPAGWTSADAAGLPMLPGLVRYDEVASGEINHALRFTAPATRRSYVYPARHFASDSTSASLPPMGLRLRLSATADLSGLSHDARVIAVALQRYGMILADNGSPWYVSGMSDPRFSDDVLHELDRFTGNDLQVVDTSGLVSTP
jgi:hypothetical protein